MSQEEIIPEQDAAAVSEQAAVESPETHQEEVHEPTMVPLAALQAERRKRQELEAKAQVYQEFLMRNDKQTDDVQQPDPTGLVENRTLQETTATTKREILELLYQDMNPTAVQDINKYLQPILEKKPWLASSVDTALNRYVRAYEIVQDYRHLVEGSPAKPAGKNTQSAQTDAQRMVANSRKPGSPVDIGKSAQPTGVDLLKSMQGKQEFRDYRKKILGKG